MSVDAEGKLVIGRPTPLALTLRFVSTPAFRTAAKILVSAGLFFWIFHKVQQSEPSMRISAGDWRPIFLVWLLQSALPFVQAQRWRLIAATLGAKLPFASAIKNVYIGQFFNQVLPSAIGGDAVRVWKLTRFMPVEVALSSVALDRVVALLGVPIILMIGSGMLARIVPAGPFRWSLFALMVAAGCGLLLLLWADQIPLPRAMIRSRLVAVVRATPPAARRLFSNPACLVRTTLLSIVIHLGVGTSLWILALNAGADAPLAAFLLLAPLIAIVTAVPISVGGWGVREGAMVTALSLVHIQPSVALTISIQFGLIMLVVGLPGGVLTLFSPTAAPRRP
jgi:glycosyltransferase 2 family protein